MENSGSKRMSKIVGLLIIIILIGAAFYVGRITVLQDPSQALTNEERAEEILEEVANLIVLPQDEVPQMVLVENAEVIKQNQPFLANAEDNDILMVYIGAQTAMLYRPSVNKLIAVGPVTISEDDSVIPQETDETAESSDSEGAEIEVSEEPVSASTDSSEADSETDDSSLEEGS